MSAEIEIKIDQILKEFLKLPKFPDGRINYSDSDRAPVLTCFVKYKDKILLLRRSNNVRTYQGKWNTVAGYIDELKPIENKALEEVREEINILKEDISQIEIGKSYSFFDPSVNKTWIVYPLLLELNREPEIKLNWEHDDSRWINPEEIKKYDIVPNLDASLQKFIKLENIQKLS